MSLREGLRKAGLTGNESRVYLQLLKSSGLSAQELARAIGMDRTLAYTVLNNLVEKGFVSYVIKDNKKYFSASDPSNLLNPLKEKEAVIESLIPKLRSLQKEEVLEQEINVYEGREGLRAFSRLLMRHKSFVSFGATGRAYDYLYEAPALAKEWKLSARIIAHPKFYGHPMASVKGVKLRFLDVKSDATTTVFGDYVSIHLIYPRPHILVWKNRQVAGSYKGYFEVLWRAAKD